MTLSPQDIDLLDAGREIDSLVAWRVMGWTFTVDPLGHRLWKTEKGFDVGSSPHPFSSDWHFAGQVVEKLAERHHFFLERPWSPGFTVWIAEFTRPSSEFEASAETAPLAICRAALKAVMQTKQTKGLSS